jgi:hypothetical protein
MVDRKKMAHDKIERNEGSMEKYKHIKPCYETNLLMFWDRRRPYKHYLFQRKLSHLITKKYTDIFSPILQRGDSKAGTIITTLEIINPTAYDTSMSARSRRDIGVYFTRLMEKVAAYADNRANLWMDNGWMGQSPLASEIKGFIK